MKKHYELIEIEENEDETGRVEVVGRYSTNPFEPIKELMKDPDFNWLVDGFANHAESQFEANVFKAIQECMKRMEGR